MKIYKFNLPSWFANLISNNLDAYRHDVEFFHEPHKNQFRSLIFNYANVCLEIFFYELNELI